MYKTLHLIGDLQSYDKKTKHKTCFMWQLHLFWVPTLKNMTFSVSLFCSRGHSIPIHPKKIQFYTWPSQNLFKFGTHKIWNVPSITKEKLAKSAHRFSRYDPPSFCCFNKKGRSHQFSNGHYAITGWPILMKLVSLERKLRQKLNKCNKKCARAI